MFECTRCGVCCRNLRMPQGNWILGLILLPEETCLFKPEEVEPMWRIGEDICFLQMKRNDCPHLQKDNSCAIYSQRPMICRSYPLHLMVTPPKMEVLDASLETKCKVLDLTGQPVKNLVSVFTKEAISAAAEMSLMTFEMAHIARKKHKKIYFFDLQTEKWIELTEAVANTMIKTIL